MRPLGDRILIKPIEAIEGLVVIPEKYREWPQEGTVIACGPDVVDLKVGDQVLYGKFSVLRIAPYGVVIRERDVIGVLE